MGCEIHLNVFLVRGNGEEKSQDAKNRGGGRHRGDLVIEDAVINGGVR